MIQTPCNLRLQGVYYYHLTGNDFPFRNREALMRTRNQELVEDIRKYVAAYYQEHLTSPGIEEIAKHVGSSKSNVQRYLLYMNDQGILEYRRGIRNPEALSRCSEGFSAHPVTGDIHCGDPRMQEAMIDEYVVLPDYIFGKGEKYILRCKGDSMEDAGISEGDLVVIRVTPDAEKGDIVVALDDDGQNTLKRYEGYDSEKGMHILGYMNQAAYPNRKIEVKELVVQGVAGQVIKIL